MIVSNSFRSRVMTTGLQENGPGLSVGGSVARMSTRARSPLVQSSGFVARMRFGVAPEARSETRISGELSPSAFFFTLSTRFESRICPS